ncbi:MAG: hypothetical protein U9R57_08095 [Thermodesulfobacteriota bacterium]|nr:hypothetical protein [Thermodesulfobacteriota bacterium]
MANDPLQKLPPTDYTIFKGEWQRTDGNYHIKVKSVGEANQVSAKYFNPEPIHISKAEVSTQQDLLRLDIKFQDSGYEGSSYTLYYYPEKDALAGFYYQAVLDRTYKVIFFRKNN